MKSTTLLHSLGALILTLSTGLASRAADDPAPPPGQPSREELREKYKNLPPAERQAKMKELREKAGYSGPLAEEAQKRQAEFQKFRASLKDLPPAERETKLRQWRETNALQRPGIATMTPEERATKQKELGQRINEQISELKKKKADGSLTEEETRRLERMETIAKRMESGPTAPKLEQRDPTAGLPKPEAPSGKK